MKTQLIPALLFLMMIVVHNQSFSQNTEKKKNTPIRLLLTAGLELGGDKVAEVYFTNGQKQGVRAGQGISAGIGAQLQVPGIESFLLRSTVGFKYVTTAADNAHIRLTRIPIVITGNYMAMPKLRLGAGISMHQNIQFKTDGLGGDYKLKPATGAIFEIAYSGIGLTYTAMKYKDDANQSYSANAIGLSFSIAIPKK